MQFTTRQLLLWFTALALWFAAMAQGRFLFGRQGSAMFGIMSAISILLAARAFQRWSRWSRAERAMSAVALFASLAGWAFITANYFSLGFHGTQQNVREAGRLRASLAPEPQYARVVITYEEPRAKRGGYLWVRGSVADQKALDSLHRTVDRHRGWNVQWDVDVAAERDGIDGE